MGARTGDQGAIDAYVAGFPDDVRPILERVCAAIRRGAPGATELIRYDMPAFMVADRYGLHFAGWKKHVGLYPVARLDEPLEGEVTPYRTAKDTVRFLYARPLPEDLIERLTRALAERHRD